MTVALSCLKDTPQRARAQIRARVFARRLYHRLLDWKLAGRPWVR